MVSCLTTLSAGLSASELFLGGVELLAANVFGGVDDLALQVARIDHIEIDKAERADAGRGQVERKRRTEPAGAHAKDARGLELLLALHADFRQDEVARVAGEIGLAELGQLGWGRGRSHGSGSPVILSLSGETGRKAKENGSALCGAVRFEWAG